MTPSEYLRLMNFPQKWETWNMVPDAWLEGAISNYKSGMEAASEHDRNGAFHWWLKSNPTQDQLQQLWQLSLLDPDQIMAEDVRGHIMQSPNFEKE